MTLIAALPMYDWPEVRHETDARWRVMREQLSKNGMEAPERLVRRNDEMPPVPGGIRDKDGTVIAPDPATLPPGELDLAVLWRHPTLLLAETCWGPMGLGLSQHVSVIGQSSYDAVLGGSGVYYRSAIIARRREGGQIAPSVDGSAMLPISRLAGQRFAYNERQSLSGYLSLRDDLQAASETLAIFSEHIETNAHRASIKAVAEGVADIAAIDCRSLMLAQRFDREAQEVEIIGWTASRKGIPYVRAASLPAGTRLAYQGLEGMGSW
ncbi:ABC-type phosphate/phosphonate transport system substrate-binding protein [Rhizobium sp. WW_1]|mgnify:CR=1 FL=1|nr:MULTISPECIES: PhnD/SsuA/transferrin family substrate-binding protein [unclassified Rhizobium]MBN8952660.1 PhnD/SsuA/transferrin family substrate-binding protein [Rhizobium tropici]RKD72686.1 ABC-type phosphate/phosphonate transport system substrate-binding protein [Rhizobium sp. WW_1]